MRGHEKVTRARARPLTSKVTAAARAPSVAVVNFIVGRSQEKYNTCECRGQAGTVVEADVCKESKRLCEIVARGQERVVFGK